jgi:hypothetical protein
VQAAPRGVDANTCEIVAVELTPDDAGDVSEMPHLRRTPSRGHGRPSATATSVADETMPMQRDRHLAMIARHGRIGWQHRSAYNRRCLVETTMFSARPSSAGDTLPNQRAEAKGNVLNWMTALGMPTFVRTR